MIDWFSTGASTPVSSSSWPCSTCWSHQWMVQILPPAHSLHLWLAAGLGLGCRQINLLANSRRSTFVLRFHRCSILVPQPGVVCGKVRCWLLQPDDRFFEKCWGELRAVSTRQRPFTKLNLYSAEFDLYFFNGTTDYAEYVLTHVNIFFNIMRSNIIMLVYWNHQQNRCLFRGSNKLIMFTALQISSYKQAVGRPSLESLK